MVEKVIDSNGHFTNTIDNMKTRNGFVSNSSSSSFVVRRYDDLFSPKHRKVCLSPDQSRKLKRNGYKLALAYYPHQVEDYDGKDGLLPPKDRRFANYVKHVICNQDDEIHFLLKNRLSFVANCHYEHESLIYDGKSDTLLIAQNFGKQAEMSGGIDGGIDFQPWKGQEALVRTTGEKYLKKYENT